MTSGNKVLALVILGAFGFVVGQTLFAASPNPAPTTVVLPNAKKEIILTETNTLSLNTEVAAETVGPLMAAAQKLDSKVKSNDPLYLVLYTPGGDIQAGLEAIEFLKSLNRPVHTITIFSASMGFHMVQGLNERYITHYGTLMAHKARGSFQGEFPGQLDSRYNYYVKRLAELDNVTANKSHGKLTAEVFKSMYENEYWVDGFDAVNQGLADAEVVVKCDQSLSGTNSQMINFFGMKFKIEFSNCPMITSPVSIDAEMMTNKGTMTFSEFMRRRGIIQPNYVTSITTDIPVAIMNVHPETIRSKIEELRVKYSKRPEVVRY